MAGTLLVLGTLKTAQGEFGPAAQCLTRSLSLYHDAGSRTRVAFVLVEVADLAAGRKLWRRAAILYGAAEPLLKSARPSPYPLLIEHARVLSVLRAHLDQSAFEAAWAEGGAMTLEQAIQLASSDDAC